MWDYYIFLTWILSPKELSTGKHQIFTKRTALHMVRVAGSARPAGWALDPPLPAFAPFVQGSTEADFASGSLHTGA